MRENDKNFSQSVIELVEFALDLKPMIKQLKDDPNKINEILAEIKAKETDQGLFEYINGLSETQQNGIYKMLEMKRSGDWK